MLDRLCLSSFGFMCWFVLWFRNRVNALRDLRPGVGPSKLRAFEPVGPFCAERSRQFCVVFDWFSFTSTPALANFFWKLSGSPSLSEMAWSIWAVRSRLDESVTCCPSSIARLISQSFPRAGFGVSKFRGVICRPNSRSTSTFARSRLFTSQCPYHTRPS